MILLRSLLLQQITPSAHVNKHPKHVGNWIAVLKGHTDINLNYPETHIDNHKRQNTVLKKLDSVNLENINSGISDN
jgi:hypothetical protein